MMFSKKRKSDTTDSTTSEKVSKMTENQTTSANRRAMDATIPAQSFASPHAPQLALPPAPSCHAIMPALPPAQSRFTSRAKIAMLSALFLLACALIFAFVLIAPAKGDVTAVGFNAPAFEDGGNLKVSSTRTLTYGNGKLVAGETGDSAVTADVANSKSNSTITTWISTKYGTDAIKDVLSNASLPNAETVDSCSGTMPQSDDSYWLSDTSDYCGFALQGYRTKGNTLGQATYYL